MATRRTIESVPLDRLCELRNPEEIARLVPNGSRYHALLLDGVRAASSEFPNSKLALEVVSDPDEPGVEEVFLLIGTRLSPQKASAALDSFFRNFWLPVFAASKGKLCVTFEFE